MSLKPKISATIDSDIDTSIDGSAATTVNKTINSSIALKTINLSESAEIVPIITSYSSQVISDDITMYNNLMVNDIYASKEWVLSQNYVTKDEISFDIPDNLIELINNKADKNHNHNDIYYSKTILDSHFNNIDAALENKADINHNHDDIYCTNEEHSADINQVNTSLQSLNNKLDTKTAALQTYIDNNFATIASIPTKTSDLVNDSNLVNSTELNSALNNITTLIPNTATAENKLVDKNFVNSSISTATATFKGTFDNLTELQQTNADLNDYAYFKHTDDNHNIVYSRYKYSNGVWNFEYDLNTTGFTAEQWATINSGITENSIPTNYVDLTSDQQIGGTKIFETIPKLSRSAYVNANIVLPDEYQLVEYIQSSGTEYIDTNSRVIANTRFTCTWGSVFNNGSFVASSTENKGYGQGNTSGSNPNIAGGGRLQNNVVTFWFSGSNYSTSLNASVSTSIYADIITTSEDTLSFSMTDIISNTLFINNTLTNFTNYPIHNMFLFRDSSGQYPFYSVKKIYDVKFETRASSSEDFIVVKHLIPCYRKSDNVCGFYDIIGNEFYTNKGTGKFIAGSNIIDGKLLYDLGFNSNTVLSELCSITGYDSSKTQVLKNVNGIFKWVNE